MIENAPSHTLLLERTLAATPERIFHAWTDPAELVLWFAPDPSIETEAEVDLRIGGAYWIRMGRFEVTGTYRVIEPPHTLVFSWRWVRGADAGDTLVTVSLARTDGGTRLTLRHERFGVQADRNEHAKGWTRSLARLVGYAVTPSEDRVDAPS